MCKNLGIQQNLSSAFHPWTDGQTEQMNAWVEQYLQPWTSSLPWTWAMMLPIAEFAHNLWKHDVTCKTPHELLTGSRPQVNVKLINENVPAALDQLMELEEAQKLAQEHLEACQKVRDTKKGQQWTEMEEGDQVWLEAKNFKVKGAKKLMPRRYGPFKIMKISLVAYQLDLPQLMKIHNVCHESMGWVTMQRMRRLFFSSHPYLHLGLSTAAWTLEVCRHIPWPHVPSLLPWTAAATLL
jgi:hypothetical protein